GTYLVSTAPPLSGVATLPGGGLFQTAGNLMYFTGYTAAKGTELWRTDGTAAGTFMLQDMTPGPDSTQFGESMALGSVLYFVPDTAAYGKELWRTDGTVAGTHIVKAIGGNGFGSDPYGLTPFGTSLYFSADGDGGNELYKTNGTAAGTVLVKDVNQDGSSFAAYTTPINGTTLLFTALNAVFYNHNPLGTELWKTNGTAAGTVMVKDIRPGNQGSYPQALVQTGPDTYQFGVVNGVAFFSADDGTHGSELWKSDGTAAGTVMVKDIAPGAASSNPSSMVVVNNKVYFIITLSGSTQLWSSDGTDAGTVMVDRQLSDLAQLTVCGTTLYVVGTRTDVGTELFMLPNVRPAPFTITQSPAPASQTLAIGATVTLTVATTGGTPTYQWRKDGVLIPGATKTTYTISKAAEAQQGSYDVLIRDGDFELLSDAAQVNVTDPNKIAITQQPEPRLTLTGGSVTFQVAAVGQTPAYQWYKGAVPIVGATAASFTLPSVQLTDAGVYKVKVSNSLGIVYSAAVQLAVVTSTDQYVPGKAGATVSMTAPAIGTGLTYHWLEYGGNIYPGNFGGRISGMNTTKLSIAKFSTSDQASFECAVFLGGQSVISGGLLPRVAAIPAITATNAPPTWIISGQVSLPATALFTQSNLVNASWNAPTSFIITGLPKGLTYDAKTGLISGRPQAGGGTSVTLSIKAGNVAGTTLTAITVTIPVQVFPALASGAFRGLADRSATTLNDNLGDYVQVDTTTLGSITGKLYRGTTAYSFISHALDTVPGSTTATAAVGIPRTGSTPLTLNITLDGSTGAMSGTLTDGVNSTPFTCKRNPWIATGATANPATAYAKAYTSVLQLAAGQQNDVNYPQGEGYAIASVTTAGAVTGAVRLADSTKVTFSTLLGAAGEVPLHIGAYANTGSLHGWSQITSATGHWDGSDSFFKAVQPPASTTRSYKAGVPLHTLTLVGGVWTKPTAAALLLGVTDSGAATAPNNAGMVFSRGGIESSGLAHSGSYPVALRIKAPASTFVLPTGTANTGKLTLAFATLTTGEITGSFTTTDANPELAGKTVTRVAPWFGVIVQRLNQGRGHFNLPKLPDAVQTNPLKTDILSGQASLVPGA
ncbi:MAG: hyalin repeat protein, partial [Verrucomicrobiaceae bacterium]|nr:hyalin repeat protein [Verrucomicrobiaceae bacterium]